MKCDAGIHEETCTYVVLSGDTTMFPSFGERVPNELTVSALHTMQIEVIFPPERKCSVWVWVGGGSPFHSRWHKPSQEHYLDIFRLSGAGVQRASRTSEPCQRCSHGGRGCRPDFAPECSKRLRRCQGAHWKRERSIDIIPR